MTLIDFRYIIAVYWVVTTLATVGYGDFKGYNSDEYLFQIGVEVER
jgi:hypothetical protein